LDVRELVRRLKLRQGHREIARELGVCRDTVGKYRKIARAEGWLDRPELPTPGEIELRLAALAPTTIMGPPPSVEPHRARVAELHALDVEASAIWQILRDEKGFTGSYSSVQRFVRKLKASAPEAFVRLEKAPGEEAQADFGSVGQIFDPVEQRIRKAYVFVMTLSFSRHMYAEIVFDQKVGTWIALHVRAFESFGGGVQKVTIDNLKSAITRAVTHDQEAQRSYRELAEHYDFLISPCVPRTPRHKGKVEKGGVHYTKRNALAGRQWKDVHEANAHLVHWVRDVAGVRDHGTTHEKPLARFEVEKADLKPLPATRYEISVWKSAKLHPDCHVVFEEAYYSAPHRLVGQKVLVRALPTRLEIYHEHVLLATHPRARHRGERISNFLHYPPTKLAGFLATPVRLREEARAIGEATAQLIERMLAEKPVDRLRPAQGILNLLKRYTPARVEAACRRALFCNEASYRAVKSILSKGLETVPLPPEVLSEGPVPKTSAFARPIHEIATGFFRERRTLWN
jgi:transposase